jgi:hypothetical protein
MPISHRHHYIPRFLIDNFADTDNKVWVYNKEKANILKNKHSSKSIFFEWNRNNFDVNGEQVDNIELMYSEIDNLLARNLEKFLLTQSMTGSELTMLILLVTLIKWRIPDSDDKFHKNFKNIPIEQLGLAIRPVDKTKEVNYEEIERIKEMNVVKEVNRILLSIQPLMREEILNEIHKNCFVVSYDKFPSLLGDVPIIENPNSNYEKLEDFIFPLSTSETLICKRGSKKYISQDLFYLQKDLTMFHLANKYVICKSREYLLKITDIYSTLVKDNNTHLLAKYVFEFIK